jgi:hypothetical protein
MYYRWNRFFNCIHCFDISCTPDEFKSSLRRIIIWKQAVSFLYNKFGVEYLFGGIESQFKMVSEKVFVPRLLHVKGAYMQEFF